MNINFQRSKDVIRRFRVAGCGAALVLMDGFATVCEAAPFDKPFGVWDFVTSGGGQRGITYLSFSNDNTTFTGFALVAGMPSAATVNNGNMRGGPDSRFVDTNSLTAGSNTVVFGFIPLKGSWQFDSRGRVIGSFKEILSATSLSSNYFAMTNTVLITNQADPTQIANISVSFTDTQAFVITNYAWATTNMVSITNLDNLLEFTDILVSFTNTQAFVITNYAWATTNFNYSIINTNNFDYLIANTNFRVASLSGGEITNSVSFTGTVVPNRRFNIVSSTSLGGRSVYRGVPATPVLPDLEGSSWYGLKRQNGTQYTEFFGLHSFSGGNPLPVDLPGIADFPNIYYTTNGVGPSYNLSGVVVVSRQHNIGFVFNETVGSNTTLRATVGSFVNARITRGVTRGVIEPSTIIRFDATRQP